jgi:hypothetical protein
MMMPLDYGVEVWRAAMKLIQECGKHTDAKAYAFGKSSEAHAKGNMEEAEHWAKIANAIHLALEGVETAEHIPTSLH